MTYEDKKVKISLRDIGEVLEFYDNIAGRLSSFNLISKGVIVNVSQGYFELNCGFEIRRMRPFSRIIKFPIYNALKVQLTSLPSLRTIDDAIISNETDGIILSIDKIPKGIENVLLNIRCPIKHPRFLDRLVYTKSQIEPRRYTTTYWLTAQFKHFPALKKNLDTLRVDDIDFRVQIHMQQDIKKIIPRSFIRQLQIGKELLQTRDRNLKMRLAREHLRLPKNLTLGKEEEIIKQIEELLEPTNFESYLDVIGKFTYYNCFPISSFFRIPNFTLPSAIGVTTKTDLSREYPATKGQLKYDRGKFELDLDEVFPRGMRKSKL